MCDLLTKHKTLGLQRSLAFFNSEYYYFLPISPSVTNQLKMMITLMTFSFISYEII